MCARKCRDRTKIRGFAVLDDVQSRAPARNARRIASEQRHVRAYPRQNSAVPRWYSPRQRAFTVVSHAESKNSPPQPATVMAKIKSMRRENKCTVVNTLRLYSLRIDYRYLWPVEPCVITKQANRSNDILNAHAGSPMVGRGRFCPDNHESAGRWGPETWRRMPTYKQ